MKTVRVSILVILAVMLLNSCSDKSKGKTFEVSGKITNAGGAKMVYLEEMPIGSNQRDIVDSAAIGKDGEYKLKTKAEEISLFNVQVNGTPLASITNDASPVTVDIELGSGNTVFTKEYTIKGSKASEEMKAFTVSFGKDLQQLIILNKQGDSLQNAKVPDSVMMPLVNQFQTLTQQMKTTTINAIKSADNPAVAMYELGYYQSTAGNSRVGLQGMDDNDVNDLITTIAAKFPDHTRLATLKQAVSARQQAMADRERQQASSSWVGKMALEFALPDVNGKLVKLSSYKGKYVLVDFWASWCGPCRYENPNVVNAYKKFKGKNFDILGVSLDDKKDKWLKAIKEDNLTWTHVSDLKKWQSEVVGMYGFGEVGIPYNFLVDPEGKIIAERLRGNDLDAKLAEVLK
jgi:peroxiredoxin